MKAESGLDYPIKSDNDFVASDDDFVESSSDGAVLLFKSISA